MGNSVLYTDEDFVRSGLQGTIAVIFRDNYNFTYILKACLILFLTENLSCRLYRYGAFVQIINTNCM